MLQDDNYDGEERRKHSRTIGEVESAFERKLVEHGAREREHMQIIVDALKSEAFPDGPAAHKAAHQAMIDAAKAEAEFWQGLKTEMVTKSIWGILRILGILMLAGLAAKLGLWPLYVSWLTKG